MISEEKNVRRKKKKRQVTVIHISTTRILNAESSELGICHSTIVFTQISRLFKDIEEFQRIGRTYSRIGERYFCRLASSIGLTKVVKS